MILQKLKTDAEAYLGEKVTDAVITVPAYFNDAQRQATKNAGQIAGLNVAAHHQRAHRGRAGVRPGQEENEKILVFDLGGGTFDVSILEVGEGVFEVKSTNGDTHLGGDDYDRRSLTGSPTSSRRTRASIFAVTARRCSVSRKPPRRPRSSSRSATETEVNLPFITADATGPNTLRSR